jgi:predicted alpha/beta superfamily hydrolase
MKVRFTALIIATMFLSASGGRAQGTIKTFTLPGIFQYDFVSRINHQPYRLTIALPFGYSTKDTTRYPVLYMLDGDPNLPLTALIQWNMTYDGEVPNLIMVGVGYQAEGFMGTVTYRTLDYTPSLDVRADSEMTAHHHVPMVSGGADIFLRVMTEEIMTFIKAHYKTNGDQALGGHSFGGLFAAHVLLTRPELFDRYLISSPSLDWDGGEIKREELRYYAAGHRSLPARVFISAGASEPDSMVPDVRALATTLDGRNYRGLAVASEIFEGETHLSVIPFSISKGLRALYRN